MVLGKSFLKRILTFDPESECPWLPSTEGWNLKRESGGPHGHLKGSELAGNQETEKKMETTIMGLYRISKEWKRTWKLL